MEDSKKKIKRYRTYKVDHALQVNEIVKLCHYELLKPKAIYDTYTKEKPYISLKHDYDTSMNVLSTNKWKSKKQLAGSILTYLFQCILEDLIYNNAVFIFPLFRAEIKFNTLSMSELKRKLLNGMYEDVDLFQTDKSVYHLELTYYKSIYQKKRRIAIKRNLYMPEVLEKANQGEVFVSYIEYRYRDYVTRVCNKFNQVDRIRMYYFIKNLLCTLITQIFRNHDILLHSSALTFHIFTKIPSIGLQHYRSKDMLIRKNNLLDNIEKNKIYLNKSDMVNLNKLETKYDTASSK